MNKSNKYGFFEHFIDKSFELWYPKNIGNGQ